MKYSILGVLLVLINYNLALCQQYSSINYSVKDGLPQSIVTAITQDEYGYLWVGTLMGGLSRFDGNKFENYSMGHGLISPSITSLQYLNNILWIGTYNGLNYYADGKFSSHPSLVGTGDSDRILKLINDSTHIWATTDLGGIYKVVDTDSVIYFSDKNGFTNEKIIDIEKDSLNALWILTAAGNVYQYNNDLFRFLKTSFTSRALSILPVSENGVLIGTVTGLHHYEIKNDSLLLLKSEFPNHPIRDISLIENELWLTLSNGMLWKTNNGFKILLERDGFTAAHILCHYVDSEGTLWFGSSFLGLYKFFRKPFLNYQFPPTKWSDIITDISKGSHRNEIIVATHGKGAFILNKETNETTPIILPSGVANISRIRSFKDHYVLSTYERGIIKYARGELIPLINPPQYFNPVMIVGSDERGLYLSDGRTLYNYDGESINHMMKIKGVRVSLTSQNMQILGTSKGLLYLCDDKSIPIHTQSQLDGAFITSMDTLSNGILLIGTLGNGLWLVKKDHDNFSVVGSKLPYSHITFTLQRNNRLLCGTEKGIAIFEIVNNKIGKELLYYTYKSGFSGVETTDEAALIDDDGNIWIGSVNGLFQLTEPLEKLTNRSKPQLNITNIYLQEITDEEPLGRSWFDVPANTTWPWYVKTVHFKFNHISLIDSDRYYYKFRLKGLSTEWSKPDLQSEIAYNNLKSGKYSFELVLVDENNEIQAETYYTFEIETPFWKTQWFYAILVLAILLTVFALLKYRISIALLNAKKVEINSRNLRRELARDFHDELGNHLASIIMLLQIFKYNKKELPQHLQQNAQNLEKHATQLFFGTKDFIASLDPEHEILEWTIHYLKDFGDNLFADTNIHFDAKATDTWQAKIKIKPYYSRHIILIFKEAMANVLKHSEATIVKLSVELKIKMVSITIEDNGKGFDNNNSTSSQQAEGIKNMEDRAEKIYARLVIFTKPGCTSIKLINEDYDTWSK